MGIVTKVSGGAKALRDVNCEVLIEIAANDPRVLVLDADLMNASGFSKFKQAFPERAINCGIQESNMIGVAGGIASMGLIPVVHSFAAFASRRVADQVFLAGSYARQNIKIFGTDPGAANSPNGATHMALEDIAIMRAMPGLSIIEPADEAMLRSLLPQIILGDGLFYIRLVRKSNIRLYADGTRFTLGVAHVAREGRDITIVTAGALLMPEALAAADRLAERGWSARILDMFTIKPLDRGTIIAAARETGAILTVDNHNVLNGLGSAVAEVLAEEQLGIPFARLGFRDAVGETGTPAFLLEKYGLDRTGIARECERLIARK